MLRRLRAATQAETEVLVGCSKASCWLCDGYLMALNEALERERPRRFSIMEHRRCSGEVELGWVSFH